MASNYVATSPYANTQMWGQFLDIWGYNTLTIPPAVTDALYQIDPAYNLRPDLLAYDLYQNTSLWWIFAIRNPDVITDPLLSFQTGVIIYVPTYGTVQTALGL
jgi:hypothetical protein